MERNSQLPAEQPHAGPAAERVAPTPSTPAHINLQTVVALPRGLADAISNSPRMALQRKQIEDIQNSPRMTAQRRQIESTLGDAVQLMGEPEQELLQGKLDTAQRRVPREEELLQGKIETTQRVENEGMPNDKFATAQLVEEEEPLQGKFETVQRVDDEEPLQGKFSAASTAQLKEEPAPKANNTGLPDNLKTGIESLSGMSMDNVKVHYNSSQPLQLNALAYAQGSDIHVAPGQQQHLPHEAWHVVQQAQSLVKPTMQMNNGVAVNDDEGLEHEADVMGERANASIAPSRRQRERFYALDTLGHRQYLPHEARHVVQNAQGRVRETRKRNDSMRLKLLIGSGKTITQRVPQDVEKESRDARALPAGWGWNTPWTQYKEALEEYIALAATDIGERRNRLLRLEEKRDAWKQHHKISVKSSQELDDDERNKCAALNKVDRQLAIEWEEILNVMSGKLDPGPLGAVAENPEISKKVEGVAKWAVFKEDAPVVDLDNRQVGVAKKDTVAKETPCNDQPKGTTEERWSWVETDKTAAGFGTVADLPEKGLVEQNKLVSFPYTKAAAGLEYLHVGNVKEQPLFLQEPSVTDVMQGGLGDCYLLAAVLGIVRKHPGFFKTIMKDNREDDPAQRTVSVRLWDVTRTGAQALPQFHPKILRVKRSIVVRQQDKFAWFARGALWVQILEKAYAAAGFTGGTGTIPATKGTYGAIEGGETMNAYEHLLGKPASSEDTGTQTGSAYGLGKGWLTHPDMWHKDWMEDPNIPNFLGMGKMAYMIEVMQPVSVSLDDLHREVEPRWEEFLKVWPNVRLDSSLKQKIFQWIERKQVYPHKRGAGQYTNRQVEIFSSIVGALNANKAVAVGSNEQVVSKGGGRGHSGGEQTGKGLAGPHAYEVVDYAPRDFNPESPAQGVVLWVKLRNPWGNFKKRFGVGAQPGRKYVDKRTEKDVTVPVHVPFRARATGTDEPEFWLMLSDLTKRFRHVDFSGEVDPNEWTPEEKRTVWDSRVQTNTLTEFPRRDDD